MKLHIKNYGPIKKCVLDLSKRYYLFVGYNNSGKTYLAKLLYEVSNGENLSKFFASDFYEIPEQKFQTSITIDVDFIKELLKKYALYIKEVVLQDALQIQSDSEFVLKDMEMEFEVSREMVEQIEFEDGDYSPIDSFEFYSIEKEKNTLEIITTIATKEDFEQSPIDFDLYYNYDNYDDFAYYQNLKLTCDIYDKLLGSLLEVQEEYDKSSFLPANRLFLLENADELVNQKNEQLVKISNFFKEQMNKQSTLNHINIREAAEQKFPSTHTKHIDTLIEKIMKLRQSKREAYVQNGTENYNDFLEKLSAIMGGEVINHKISDLSYSYERFKIKNGNADKSLRLYLASSSVNQLSVLYLYFKYWASESGNLLIIDEPEENLHPKSQIALFTLLLEFASVNANRVVITTHSPLLAEVMNNYLVLGQLENKTEMAEKLGLSDIDLNPENTGIYAFNGSTVQEYMIGDYGTIFTSFKEAQDTVYRLGEVLDDEMYKQKNKNNP